MFFLFTLLLSISGLEACSCCPKERQTKVITQNDITIQNAYFSAMNGAKNAAAYLSIKGTDTLLKASYFGADIKIVELHTHILDDKGIAKMRSVECFPISGEKIFKPGEDHIMLIKVSNEFHKKEYIDLILEFEKAGKIKVRFDKKESTASCCSHP